MPKIATRAGLVIRAVVSVFGLGLHAVRSAGTAVV
jgi:hypothetical protein